VLGVTLTVLRGPVSSGIWFNKGRNGEVWGAGDAQIRAFGESYRLNQTESLFNYRVRAYSDVNKPNATQNYNGCSGNASWTLTCQKACGALASNGTLTSQCASYRNDSAAFYGGCVTDCLCSQSLVFAEGSLNAFGGLCQTQAGALPISLAPSAAASTAIGGGLNATAKRLVQQTFVLTVRDVLGRVVRLDPAPFVVSATPFLSISTSDNHDGSMKALYTAITLGAYQISVVLNGIPIGGSPFPVNGMCLLF